MLTTTRRLFAAALRALTTQAGKQAAAQFVPLRAQALAANRAEFGIFPITDEIIANRQATASRFHRPGLIPNPIRIADAVWMPPGN